MKPALLRLHEILNEVDSKCNYGASRKVVAKELMEPRKLADSTYAFHEREATTNDVMHVCNDMGYSGWKVISLEGTIVVIKFE